MTRRLPPLNAIRAFEAAGRHVSFTKAATELHVTHGAVSRHVAQLERWLGTSLFERSASRLTLTQAGRTYLAEATAVLDRLAVASMHAIDQAMPISLVVNAPPTFTMRWLIPRISRFQRRRAGVEVRLTTSYAPINFHENTYDVAIRGARGPLPNVESTPFLSESIVPICHKDLITGGHLRAPGDLARQTLISYATEPYCWSDWLSAAGEPHLRPKGQLKFEQMYFALHAASEGLGVALVPLFLVIDDILEDRLCAPFGMHAAMRRQYFAYGGQRNMVTDSFCAWLVDEGAETEKAIASWTGDQVMARQAPTSPSRPS